MIERLRQSLAGKDPSLPLVVAALLRGADERGGVRFGDLAVAYRERYLEAQQIEWGEAVRQRGALSVDEVRRHLRASVLPRLVGEEIVETISEPIDDQFVVALRAEVWQQIGPDVEGAVASLMDMALDGLRAAETVGAEVEIGGSTLSAQGLVKSYRRRRVVNDVDLDVREGEIVGLLGPNGAGNPG
jgi:ABC-type glutathione transport system ATPase component